jgi:hypothetical protein
MKKLSVACAALSFVFAGAPAMIASPAQAAANPNVALCRDLIATDPDLASLSLGACVSLLTVEDNYFGKGTGGSHAVAVKFCKLYEDVYPADFDLIWGSRDVCIDDIEASL